MTGYRWAWSRFRILRIVFFLLLIIGFRHSFRSALSICCAHRNLLGYNTARMGLYLWN